MFSFIEIPRLHFDGRDAGSVYVNTRDIISVSADYHGQTVFEVRGLGSEGHPARFVSYIPIASFLDILGLLADNPGVRSFDESFKQVSAAKLRPLLQEQAQRERAAR